MTEIITPGEVEKKIDNTIEDESSSVTIKTEENENKNSIKNKSSSNATDKPIIPRGKPKSGRIWKTEKKKFSSIVKTKGIRNSFEKKQALRVELKRVKETSRAIIAAKKEEVELKKQRRRDNLKKQEENRQKSEIVQVIKNPHKIKRMRKKQLRMIEKRDTTNM